MLMIHGLEQCEIIYALGLESEFEIAMAFTTLNVSVSLV